MQDTKQTNEELFQLIKQNDKQAFRILFNRHYKILLGTAINMLHEVPIAKDIVQDVFLKLWQKRMELTIHSNPAAYLKRAVINRALNQIKSKKSFVQVEELLEEKSQEATALQQLAAEDLKTALNQALDTLPEKCRLIYTMRRLEGMSLKEIASHLDISPKTVENQITKALKVLKEAARPFLPDP